MTKKGKRKNILHGLSLKYSIIISSMIYKLDDHSPVVWNIFFPLEKKTQ